MEANMICPKCQAKIADGIHTCPFCGASTATQIAHTLFGKISIILALFVVISITAVLGILALYGYSAFYAAYLFSFVLAACAIVSIIAGLYAFMKKPRDTYGLIGMLIGFCICISILFTSALSPYVFVTQADESSQLLSFLLNDIDDTLIVSSTKEPILWDNIEIDGSYTGIDLRISTGYVDVGDAIVGCSGVIRVIHTPTNTILGPFIFT